MAPRQRGRHLPLGRRRHRSCRRPPGHLTRRCVPLRPPRWRQRLRQALARPFRCPRTTVDAGSRAPPGPGPLAAGPARSSAASASSRLSRRRRPPYSPRRRARGRVGSARCDLPGFVDPARTRAEGLRSPILNGAQSTGEAPRTTGQPRSPTGHVRNPHHQPGQSTREPPHPTGQARSSTGQARNSLRELCQSTREAPRATGQAPS